MKTIIPVALLALVFLNTPTEGTDVPQLQYTYDAPKLVNLTEKAAKLIKDIVGSRTLKNFSFTDGDRLSYEHAVTSKVSPLSYGTGCEDTSPFQNSKCKEMFNWQIDNGIVTPLDLLVNVTVSVVSKGEPETLLLNLNGAPNITWTPNAGDQKDAAVRTAIVKQECKFSALTTFTGYIYYEADTRYSRGDVSGKDAVGIIYLENKQEGLVKLGDSLLYNVTGTFRRQLICASEDVTRDQ
uniref:DA-P36 family member n=1 Tax=Rhipicephalus appendiculatus TaxID=34631 RepID=A0A131YJG2_RHIAP